MTETAHTDKPIHKDNSRWASRIAARYRCELSPELVDWFDSEIWNHSGCGEYRQPIHPSELLSDAPESVWPALMPCDMLPISGNNAGDWLCLRMGANNSPREVVQWYHGGGDWIPWGRSLAEALVFDALSVKLPGPLRRHSVPAENPRPDVDESATNVSTDPLLQWAATYVPAEVASLLESDAYGSAISDTLLKHGVAEVAVRCEAVLDALHQSITALISPKLAEQWNVSWEEMVQWSFDANRIPTDRRRQLEERLETSIGDEQDWAMAAQHCRAVTKIDAQLAWPWEILGYAAERSGHTEDAMEAYARASRLSVFTDQSVRLRTYWETSKAAKFSAARMLYLRPELVASDDYLRLLCIADTQQRRGEVCQFWRTRAATAKKEARFNEAYDDEFAAGWDLGAEPMRTFGGLLDSIADSAQQAGQTAKAELAKTHRVCLASRYRV